MLRGMTLEGVPLYGPAKFANSNRQHNTNDGNYGTETCPRAHVVAEEPGRTEQRDATTSTPCASTLP